MTKCDSEHKCGNERVISTSYLKPNGKKDYWKIVRRHFLDEAAKAKKHNSTAN